MIETLHREESARGKNLATSEEISAFLQPLDSRLLAAFSSRQNAAMLKALTTVLGMKLEKDDEPTIKEAIVSLAPNVHKLPPGLLGGRKKP